MCYNVSSWHNLPKKITQYAPHGLSLSRMRWLEQCQSDVHNVVNGTTIYDVTLWELAVRQWRLTALDVVGTITADAHYHCVLQQDTTNCKNTIWNMCPQNRLHSCLSVALSSFPAQLSLYTVCPNKTGPNKVVAIMQQKLVGFVWNFRRTNKSARNDTFDTDLLNRNFANN